MSPSPEREEAVKLERGMLLLEPASGDGKPMIWAVSGHERAKPVLVAATPELLVKKTLRRNALPDGWSALENRSLAAAAVACLPQTADEGGHS